MGVERHYLPQKVSQDVRIVGCFGCCLLGLFVVKFLSFLVVKFVGYLNY